MITEPAKMNENPTRTSKFKDFLRSLGPGFITASVVLGPGSIAVSSRVGSEYGYSLLWVVVLAAICMGVFVSMGVRYGVMNKLTILENIRKTYGRWFTVAIGVTSFLGASSFQFGNNLGIGIGMEGVTGIDERVWPVVFTFLAFILLYKSKNLYKALEKLMMGLIMLMILAFFANLLFANPDVSGVVKGLVPKPVAWSEMEIMAAMIATTFAINGAVYQSYLVQEKGVKRKDLKSSITDSKMGILFLALISILIIVTSAAALYPLGITVTSAAEMAMQLESLFGPYAKIIFSLGLCAAAFSSLMVNAVIGGGLFSDSLGLGKGMQERYPRIFTSIILLIGMIVSLFYRGDVIYALIIAQAATLVAVPLIASGMFLIANNKKIMGATTNSRLQNFIAIVGFVLILIIMYSLVDKLIIYLQTI